MPELNDSYKDSFFAYFSKPKKENPLKKIRNWGREKKTSFNLSVFASIAFHVFIILLLFILPSLFTHSGSSINYNLKKAAFNAYADLESMLPVNLDLNAILTPNLKSKITQSLEEFGIFGEEMDEEEVSELFAKMLDAYINSRGLALGEDLTNDDIKKDFNNFIKKIVEWKLDSGKKVFLSVQSSEEEKLNFRVVSDKTLANLDYVSRVEQSKSNYFYIQGAELVRVKTQKGEKVVPAAQFFRDSPYEELLANGAELFNIIRGFPLVWEPKTPSDDSVINLELSQPKVFDESISVFLTDHLPFSAITIETSSTSRKEKFQASDDSIKKILDALMVHPDTKQLELFRQNYIEQYDHDSEDLITLTNRFIHNNLTNIFIILSDVSAAFDFVEEVYFNKSLENDFYNLWMQYPSSRVGLEFLLCLASHYDFERRTLEFLFNAYDDANDFIKKKNVNAEIHDKSAKCYVIRKINQDLTKNLSKLGYKSQKEVVARYIEEEEKIYRHLIQMGGEAENLGLYALGCLYWSMEKYDLALQHWYQIDPNYTQNKVLQEIRDVFLKYDSLSKAIAQINSIQDYHQIRGTKALLERLVRFKRWKTRYSNK